jgi:sugar porter (SP) family MFS transporter
MTSHAASSAGYRLLDQQSSEADQPSGGYLRSTMGKRLGTFRAIYVVAVCAIGSFLFAYDTGIVGGVLTLPSFQRDFRYTKAEKTHVNSTCVSILQAGAFFGCFAVWPITSWLGRRWAYVISSVVFCIGAIIQTINTHSIGAFYAGRVISGLGTGAATVLVPMFSAEMAPKEIRGMLGSCFQLFFATGVCVSYWTTYAASAGLSEEKSLQWQVPVGLQLVPGALMGLGMLLVKESVRWLAKKGRNEEAFESLLWVRGGEDTAEVRAEFAEILTGVELEIQQSEGVTWKELLLPSNRLRMFIAITIQLCQQLTGNTSLAYYAPQIFATIGAGNKSLFITGFFGLVKMAGVAIFLFFFVDRIGRKKPFMAGAFAMGAFMLIIALIVATHPPKKNTENAGITAAGAAGITMVYLEAFSFNMSWGPLPWLYIGEIFPNRIREIGIAAGAGSQWLFNFMMSQITPYAIDNIGWRTFLMFAIFNFAIVVYSYFVLRETAGKSLEEMEVVFGTVDRLPTKADDDAESATRTSSAAKDTDGGNATVEQVRKVSSR